MLIFDAKANAKKKFTVKKNISVARLKAIINGAKSSFGRQVLIHGGKGKLCANLTFSNLSVA